MSISSEIGRIGGAKTDIADAIEDMGVTVPSGTRIDGLASLIQSGVNGHIQNMNNPHQVTAQQALAVSRVCDHKANPASGWVKVAAIDMSTAQAMARVFTLRFFESYANNSYAVVKYYFYRTVGGSFTDYARLMSCGVYTHESFAYTISSGIVNLYVRKKSAAGGYLLVQVLSSVNKDGDFVDLTPYWTSVSETPTNPTYSLKLQDGEGYDIAGTYQLQIKGGTISLPLSWSGSGPYTDTATLTGTTATSQSMVSLQPTAAQLQQLITDGVTALYIENNSGTLTAYALGAAPSTAMTIQCTLTEVN